jgi:hypothetical protein
MSGYWIFILYVLPLVLAAGGFLVAYLYARRDRHHRHLPPGE